jgi:hypothetical protein
LKGLKALEFFSKGDSGGPLIHYNGSKPVQIGVLSIASSLCGYNHTAHAAHISVPYFRTWIDSILSVSWCNICRQCMICPFVWLIKLVILLHNNLVVTNWEILQLQRLL